MVNQVDLENREVVPQESVSSPTLTAKLSQAKTSTQVNLQRLNILLGGDEEIPQTEVSAENSLADARPLLENLTSSEDKNSDEYLKSSVIALREAERMKQRIRADQQGLEASAHWRGYDRSPVDNRLAELDRLRWFKRIPAVFERRRLNSQKLVIQREVEEIASQVQSKKELLAQIQNQEIPVKERREEMLFTEISQAVQDVKSRYEQFLQDILDDGKISSEIRSSYIQRIVEPELERFIKSKKLPVKSKAEFYKALNAFLDHKKSPIDEKKPYEETLNSWLKQDGFSGVKDECQYLFKGVDEGIIQGFVAKLAAADIASVRSLAQPHFREWESAKRFDAAFRNAIEPEGGTNWWPEKEATFGSRIIETVNKSNNVSFPNMHIWQAIKDSPTASQLFGDMIIKQDQEYYHTALDKSLSDTDGGYIDKLIYYPTPEAIRNLVLLASADNQNYRTVHANGSLCALARRSDWKDILDKAEIVYPSLKGPARQMLDSWNFDVYSNLPGIQETVSDFALDIFESPLDDKRLISLATEALSNGLMLDVLAKRGIVPIAITTTLKETESFLTDLSEDLWKKRSENPDSDIPYIYGDSFHRTLREALFPLLKQQDATEQLPILFNRFETLSLLILQNKANLQLLDNLTDSNLIYKIKDPSKKVEGAFLFLQEFQHTDQLLSTASAVDITKDNWQVLLMMYIRSHNEIPGLPQLSPSSLERINGLFDNPKTRNLCLNELDNSWRSYLKDGKPGEIPVSASLIPGFTDFCGGAGPLSQVEAFCSFVNAVDRVFSKPSTAERTKIEICQGLAKMEERFIRDRWSNEGKTDFYNISRDIMQAAPSLFSDYLSIFEKLTPSQMKQFANEIYPLYRTRLVLMEREDEKGNKIYDKRQLLQLRKEIRDFANVLDTEEKPFEAQKKRLLEGIRNLFKDRFGIIKIPETFTPEHMRSFTNVCAYLANLHGRTSEKEAILGFYLSLMINDSWDTFRSGGEIKPDEYLTPEKSYIIKTFLRERQRLNPLLPESLGIPEEDMPEFLKLLQQETQNMVVGNIETIDVKLTNIILNLQGLEDLDLYPDVLDKQRMQLLLDWGNKKVGSVVARIYQSIATPAKSIQFSEEDTKIQQQVTRIIQESGLSLTPQTLKEHFQDGIRPLATVVNLLRFVDDTHAEHEIELLRGLLKPSQEIIEVFRRLGEDFKPTSGAMALSQDLSYLDNLVVKREDEIEPQEKVLLVEYINNIRTQVVKLEGLYGQIKNKFSSLKQGSNESRNPLLKNKLDQIDRIVNAQVTQQAITSTITNNLNTIIENIRECLSCTREGCNNDTDLTFGDMNKFYLYSQTETQQQGSISDQLVFVEPVTRTDSSQRAAFVLDRIYGTSTPTILVNQIEAVLKKYRVIKQRFPDIRLSVFVSDAAISTGGTFEEMLLERFKQQDISGLKETIEVNVAESATGDHYIEFGGNARTSGKRKVSGIFLST